MSLSKERIRASLFGQQKDIGFRFGFLALMLVAITAAYPAFIGIGSLDPQLQGFTNIFVLGLVMTIFFSWALRDMARRRQKKKQQLDGGIFLDPMNVYKQVMVLTLGLAAGIIMVMVNIYINIAGHANVLLASAFGTISPQAFYLGMLAGVSEELFFRGFFQTFFEIFFGGTLLARLMAPIPSAAIFAWFHFYAYADPIIFMVLFAMGLILGYLHSFTNDIGVPMLAHVINNTFAMLGGVIAVINQNAILIGGIVAFAIFMYFVGVAQTAKMKKGGK